MDMNSVLPNVSAARALLTTCVGLHGACGGADVVSGSAHLESKEHGGAQEEGRLAHRLGRVSLRSAPIGRILQEGDPQVDRYVVSRGNLVSACVRTVPVSGRQGAASG